MICVGTRWKCGNGHEWVAAHGDCIWFAMPVCPTCNLPAIAQRGEWREELTERSKDAIVHAFDQEFAERVVQGHPCHGCVWFGKDRAGQAGCCLHQKTAVKRCQNFSER